MSTKIETSGRSRHTSYAVSKSEVVAGGEKCGRKEGFRARERAGEEAGDEMLCGSGSCAEGIVLKLGRIRCDSGVDSPFAMDVSDVASPTKLGCLADIVTSTFAILPWRRTFSNSSTFSARCVCTPPPFPNGG